MVRYREGSLARGTAPIYRDVVTSLCMEGRTACVKLVADIEVSCGGDDAPWKLFPKVHLGSVPVMVGSSWMPIPQSHADNDLGGYFVINGRDVVIPALERTAQNRVLVVQAAGSSSNEERSALVYSTSIGPGRRVSTSLRLTLMRDGRVHASSEGRLKSTPVVVLLRLLGMHDRNVCVRSCELWGLPRHSLGMLDPSFDEADEQEQEQDQLEWLLPHVGDDPGDKAFFLCHMIRLVKIAA